MLGAGVPEATVDHNCDATLPKDYVGSPSQLGYWLPVDSIAQTECM